MKMKLKSHHFLCLKLLFLLYQIHQSQAQPPTYGYSCTPNTTTNGYPCQTYVFYRTTPDFSDLASIGDLFNVSRLSISKPSNISNPALSLIPNQGLFVPITCGCNPVKNKTLNFISFANETYTIKKADTFYYVSTHHFGNLTTYQSVEVVNPTLIPEFLDIGIDVYFPIFCKCPNKTQSQNKVNFLVTYVFQPGDTLDSVASTFGVTKQAIVDVNGNNINIFDAVFVPVAQLPTLKHAPGVNATNNTAAGTPAVTVVQKKDNKGAVVGLGVGLGISVLLLVLSCGFLVYREAMFKKRMEEVLVKEEKLEKGGGGRKYMKEMEQNLLLADVSDTLDKYKVFEIDELRNATSGFDQKSVVQGSVYKGHIEGKLYAIKKMKWNAYEELKILQKVNHGNLVRLEGFCIDPEDASCYLVYEYIENGSLHTWLHDPNHGKLKWKARVRIAIDVANGLQYIHEHTTPQVVHKDIKTTNILLDANMRGKIANFGLAKSGCNAITMHIVGTQGYIAPEYLADGVVSPKMDVFAFGVVLLELISGREAVDKEGRVLYVSAREVWEGTTEEEKMRKVVKWADGVLLEESCSAESLINVMAVAIACTNKDPAKRPTMVDVVYALCKGDDFFYDISTNSFNTSPLKAR